MFKLLFSSISTSITPYLLKISAGAVVLLLVATLVLGMLLKASYGANGELKADISKKDTEISQLREALKEELNSTEEASQERTKYVVESKEINRTFDEIEEKILALACKGSNNEKVDSNIYFSAELDRLLSDAEAAAFNKSE